MSSSHNLPRTIPATPLRLKIQEQAASLAEAAGISVEEATSTIEQIVFINPSPPPKNWAEQHRLINEAILESLRIPEKCCRCGSPEVHKTTLNGWLCEKCANYRGTPIINEKTHTGRNDPCPCGSGKKFKACCRV